MALLVRLYNVHLFKSALHQRVRSKSVNIPSLGPPPRHLLFSTYFGRRFSASHLSDANVLHFRVVVQAVLAAFTALATLFDAPKGHPCVRDRRLVEPDHPVFQPLRHANALREVFCEKVRRQAEYRVVGSLDDLVFCLERENRRNGAESLLRSDEALVGYVRQQCRGVKIVSQLRQGLSTDEKIGSVLNGVVDVLLRLVHSLLVDHRANFDPLVQSVADLEFLDEFPGLADELFLYVLVHIDAVGTDTCLAAVAKLVGNHALSSKVDVGIAHDYQWSQSTELHRHSLHCASCLFHQNLANVR
mmetsp:Transcript_12701/g.38935  ORF Transcript_12701/g.38935 Transcript_12701/m.38935 type:complete len:302 (-) Transcript_12701:1131-2036(-)